MCAPLMAVPAMAYASMALTAVSTVVGVMSAQQNAAAQQEAANYQAQVAHNSAVIAKQNADATLEAGAVAEQRQRMKTAALIGQERAAMGANGIRLDDGSALDLQSDSATLGELDALTVRNNAARQAWAYLAQGNNLEAQAELDRAQGGWARSAGNLQSFGTLLGGAASMANQGFMFNRLGAFDGGANGLASANSGIMSSPGIADAVYSGKF